MEQENNKKKMILPMVLGITVLSILVLGATYAYFTVGTSNNFGSKIITANMPEIGNVALTSGESLSLNMTSELMMEENIGEYYATTTGVPSTTLTEEDIAVASVIGTGNFNCTYDLTITPTSTNSLYTAFTGMTGHDSNQIVLKVGSHTYDFNTTDFSSPITISETFSNLTSSASQSIKASLKFVNTSFDQNDLQGKDITFTFTASNLSCVAVEVPTATLVTGSNFNKKMKTLAGNNLSNITSFKRASSLPSEYESSDYEIQSNDSDEKIYMWYDNGAIKYYTEAGKIYLNEDSSGIFASLSNATSIDVNNFDTSKVINMSGMFANCRNLTSLDLSDFNTSNVTNIYSAFYNCSSLTSLNLSGFDTSNVTDMQSMFSGCSSLTSLDLSSFDTSKVTNMKAMFNGASALMSLDLSSFDTSNVTDMTAMFNGCSSLTSLDLSSFDTSKVTNMSGMFLETSELSVLDLSSFETTSLNNTTNMFYNNGVTIGYAKTQADADLFNASTGKPSWLIFNVKAPIDTNELVGNFVTLDNQAGIYYRVLYNESGNTYMLLGMNTAGVIAYNEASTTVTFENGSEYQKYAGSTIDTYMNETYYNTLSTNIKNAIVSKTINQGVYSYNSGTPSGAYYMKGTYGTNNSSYWIGYVSKVEVGTRKVYALDIEDVLKYLGKDNLSMANINNMFFNTSMARSVFPTLRSAYSSDSRNAWNINGSAGAFNTVSTSLVEQVRPAFLIDLSKVDFEVFEN